MTKKPVIRTIVAYATAVMTMAVMCGMPTVAFAADNGVTKEETVYVVTDASGTQQDVIVSDHLINKDKIKTIADQSNLSDIENVKGEETFKQDGEALTWDAEGNGIYYQGKSEDEIPVAMDIVYRLNDKVVSGSELQGQSGKVEIKINYTNDAEYEGTTVPFIVMTGMVITDDSFKNVKITKGKVIDDGDKLMVVGMAAPGLAQTLDIGESDLGIGSSITITGDADKFAVEDMMTIVTNAFFEDVDTDSFDLDYDDEIKELDKGAKALAEGSDKLYEGLDTLAENMPDLQDGVGQLKDGSKELAKGTNEAKKGAKKLADGSVTLSKSIKKSLKEIAGYTGQFAAGEKSIYQGLNVLKNGDGTAQNPGVIASLGSIKGGIDGVANGSGKVSSLAGTAAGYAGNAYSSSVTAGNKVANAGGHINDALNAAEAIKESNPEAYAEIAGALAQAGADIADTGNEITKAATAAATAKAYLNNEDEDVNSIKEIADQLNTSSQKLSAGTSQLSKGLDQGLGDETNAETLIGGSYKIWKSLEQMQAQIESNLDKKSKLSIGLATLTNGTKDLAKGEVKLAGGAQQLADGMAELNDKSDTMVDGVYQLSDGAYKLRKGMSEMYKQGIKKIVDMYNDDLKGTLDSADAMIDAGKGYKTFTRLASGMDGNVKFIYKTDMTN